MNFEIIAGEATPSVPLVVHIPHSATAIPPEVRRTFCLNDDQLRRELLRMTDWYTDRLFHGAAALGGTLFINRMSRLVVDPERFPDDRQEVMAAKGMGAVYTKTADGQPLRRPWSPKERTDLLDAYFHPYAQSFEAVVSRMLDRHGRCLIIDGHSFPSVPLPYEQDQETPRPEICLGIDDLHTPEALVGAVETLCVGQRLRVARNTPFAGTYVPLRYWHRESRVSSIMIEIRRDLYMDEETGAETQGLTRTQELIASMLERLTKSSLLASHFTRSNG